MAAPLLTAPPNDGLMWIPPGALGPQFTYLYTLGRNDGKYLTRKRRTAVHIEISHTMGGPGTETPQTFANGEMGASATLAEIATFPAAAWNTGKPVLLQSLPLDIIGAGSVDGGATGITHESAELAGDPNAQPWTPDHLELKAALSAWLIRNPLRWPKLAIRYQVCKSPYGPTPELGGLGAHTMWDTCGVAAGGTNPWTLVCKALAVDTVVPTPGGFARMGDLAVGDHVYDENGQPCRVTMVTDRAPTKVWQITFSNGTSVLADDEHEWVTINGTEDRTRFVRGYPTDWADKPSRTSGEIAATLRQARRGNRPNHVVPALTAPLLGVKDDLLPLDPYLFGVWLGDGTTRDAAITASTDDAPFYKAAFEAAGFGIGATNHLAFTVLGLSRVLRLMGVQGDKHVPHRYLHAAAEQRLALLQGLMDTDGSITPRGQCSFSNANEQLSRAVFWLAASLGSTPRIAKYPVTVRGVEHQPRHVVTWSSDLPCFRLPRKLHRVRTFRKATRARRIVSMVEATPVPMRCIMVDSPRHMYLVTEACIPTHNSCPGWERRGTQRKVMFPNSLVTDIPFEAGNFRDYYERVGALLAGPAPQPQEDDPMYVRLDTDAAKPGAAIWTAGGGWVSHVTTGADVLPAGSPIVSVPLAWFSRQYLLGPLPSDPNHAWKAAEFRGHVPDPTTWKGPQGDSGPPGADGVIPPGTQAQVTFA